MPKINQNSNLFEQTENITKVLSAKGENLKAVYTATIALKTVIADLLDYAASKDAEGLPVAPPEVSDWLQAVLDDEAHKEQRILMRNTVQPLMTASKNYQDSYCVPSGLMQPSKSAEEKSEEFA